MQFQVRLVCVPISLLFCCVSCIAQSQKGTIPHNLQTRIKQPANLVPVKMPTAPYPQEALKRKVQGTVALTIVVNAQGRVSDAKVLSGPRELAQAALDSTRLWEFVPPDSAPVTETVTVSYGFPRECSGRNSDTGVVTAAARFTSHKGNVIGMDEDLFQRLPPYPAGQRQAGVAGRMQLSITVDPSGAIAQVSVVKSLSRELDDAAMDTVRAWKFILLSGDWESFPDNFTLPINFQPTCSPRFD